MKNIIIGGTVRAGKSTLAEKIVKHFKYSLCECDAIVNAFDIVFPELGIIHRDPEGTREKFKPFLHVMLSGFGKDLKHKDLVTVFPGSQFMPSTINEYEKKDKWIVIFLGMNDVSDIELFKKMREMDKPNDWTFKESDERLLRHCSKIIKESKTLEEECKKYGFYYFNTFNDREKVFNDIIKLIEIEQEK